MRRLSSGPEQLDALKRLGRPRSEAVQGELGLLIRVNVYKDVIVFFLRSLVLPIKVLCVVCGLVRIPRRGRAIVVWTGPKEDEAHVIEIELIDEPLVGDPELFQVWKGGQQTLNVGVVPHFVITDGGENATRKPGGAHL